MRRYLLPRGHAVAFLLGLMALSALHYSGILSLHAVHKALPTLCPFKALTGFPCPGCGMTSALLATAQGNVAAAATHNPFVILLLLLAGLSILPKGIVEKMPARAPALMHYFLVLSLLSVGMYWLGSRIFPLLI